MLRRALVALLALLLPLAASAAKRTIKAGATDQTVDLWIQDSSSTTGAGLSGLVYNSAGLACYYRKGAAGSATQLTLATQTVGGAHSDGGFVEIQATNMKGLYRLDLSDTIVATAGWAVIQCYGATNMAPVVAELEIVSYDPFDATRLGLAALPNAAAEAAGGVITRGTGTGQLEVSSGKASAQVKGMDADTVTASAVAADAIGASELATDSIGASEVAAGAIVKGTEATGWNDLSAADVRSAVGLASANLDTQLAAIDDYVDTEVAAILAAVRLASGTCDSGTTTTCVDAARTESDADYWAGQWLCPVDGNIDDQCRLITAFDQSTDTLTVYPAQTQAWATQGYQILPGAAVNLAQWRTSAPSSLISGRVDANAQATASSLTYNLTGNITGNLSGSVGSVTGNVGGNVTGSIGSVATGGIAAASFAAGAIDAAAIADGAIDAATLAADTITAAKIAADAVGASEIAADALGSSELATTAVNEIVDQTWEETLADHSGTSGSTAAALNAAGSAGDPWATALPGAYGAGTAGKIIGDSASTVATACASPTEVQTELGTYGALKPTTAGRTLDVTAGGEAGLDLDNTAGGLAKGTEITGFNDLSAAQVESEVNDALVAQRLDELLNADSDIDGAAPPTVGSVWHEALTKTTGSFTYDQTTDSSEAIRDNMGTAQTGDAYARLGAPAGASTAADIAAMKAETAAILSDTNLYDTDAEHAAALWNAATASYGSAGSYGLLIETNLDAQVSGVGGGSCPTVAQIWGEDLPGSYTGNDAGAKLNSASSAGDPWATDLPGSYTGADAGALLYADYARLLSNTTITVSYGVPLTGAISLRKGNSYSATTNATTADRAGWRNLTGATLRTYIKTSNSDTATAVFDRAATVVTAGAGTQTIRVDFTAAETAALAVGSYYYYVRATYSDSEVATLLEGALTVKPF